MNDLWFVWLFVFRWLVCWVFLTFWYLFYLALKEIIGSTGYASLQEASSHFYTEFIEPTFKTPVFLTDIVIVENFGGDWSPAAALIVSEGHHLGGLPNTRNDLPGRTFQHPG